MSDNTNTTNSAEVILEIQDLCKSFGDHEVLKGISTTIRKGDVLALIGPSGCGKSTLLRIIGNLDKPTSGTIEYRDGADQQMGFVFQDSVLLPWKNVRQNAEFPLVIQKKKRKENEEKLDERLSMAGIEVVEARINYLAYAPEIAAVMLRRQQADAIISAREKIVEGAVSMVKMALDKLNTGTLNN